MLRFRWPFLLLFINTPALAQATPSGVELRIRADSAPLVTAAAEYRAIWAQDGARIVSTMQSFSGLQFRESSIPVQIVTGPSSSGYGARPMRLRGSYPEPTKRATLIHELGHRLQNELFARDEDDHPALFLWLFDVWTALYGTEFARQQVEVESARTGGRHDYRAMWAQALAMDSSARADAWRRLRNDRQAKDSRRRLTRACSRRAALVPSPARALRPFRTKWNEGLYGRRHEGPQLMRIPSGRL